jgi:succinate dehydrogenase/fumarate reductase flavoprotein subunit
VANDMRATMQQHAGVFRTQASMDEGVKKIADRERVARSPARTSPRCSTPPASRRWKWTT